jgi:hypothetical protein
MSTVALLLSSNRLTVPQNGASDHSAPDTSEVAEAYTLWRAAGGDPERELLSAHPPSPPLLRMPKLILLNNSGVAPRAALLSHDSRHFVLTMALLRRRPSQTSLSLSLPSPAAQPAPLRPSSSYVSLPSVTPSSATSSSPAPPASPRSLGTATAARAKFLKDLLSALPASLPRLAQEIRGDVPATVRSLRPQALCRVIQHCCRFDAVCQFKAHISDIHR